ncbi:MAG: glycerol-3-phosphate acyltransferase [Ignavibacteriae bacterium]|nr:glycerol-3-phosphate acyltransferase [Ignavibacteriota bacterium]
MTLSILLIITYIIGSFPTGFIVLKITHNLDIRKVGSGNVGTLNSFEVTNSKKIGIFVLFVDLIKGIISIILAKLLIPNDFFAAVLALNSAVLGHCYSIWIKFSGGRGLATAAGGALVLSPAILIIWLFNWVIMKKISSNIHVSNFGATIMVIIFSIFFSEELNLITFPPAEEGLIFIFSISLLMFIILTKHITPLKEIIYKN